MELSFAHEAPEAKVFGLTLVEVTKQDCKGSGWNVGVGFGPFSAGLNGNKNKCVTKRWAKV
jgi:hypothetical protein